MHFMPKIYIHSIGKKCWKRVWTRSEHKMRLDAFEKWFEPRSHIVYNSFESECVYLAFKLSSKTIIKYRKKEERKNINYKHSYHVVIKHIRWVKIILSFFASTYHTLFLFILSLQMNDHCSIFLTVWNYFTFISHKRIYLHHITFYLWPSKLLLLVYQEQALHQ